MKVENNLYVQVMALKRGVHGRRASILCEKKHCLVELLDLLFYLSLLKDSTFFLLTPLAVRMSSNSASTRMSCLSSSPLPAVFSSFHLVHV